MTRHARPVSLLVRRLFEAEQQTANASGDTKKTSDDADEMPKVVFKSKKSRKHRDSLLHAVVKSVQKKHKHKADKTKPDADDEVQDEPDETSPDEPEDDAVPDDADEPDADDGSEDETSMDAAPADSPAATAVPDQKPETPQPAATPPAPIPTPPKPAEPILSRRERTQEIIDRLRKRYQQLQDTKRRKPASEQYYGFEILSENIEPPPIGFRTSLLLAESSGFESKAFVTLWPSPKAQKQLARFGGVSPEDIHMTLLCLGDLDKLGHVNIASAASVCEKVASATRPFSGMVLGIGRFSSLRPDEHDTIYATFSSPKLDVLRYRLVRSMKRAGVPLSNRFGFTPHLTLAKIPQAAVSPLERLSPFRLRFTRLTFGVGTWKHHYKLGA